RACGEHVPLVVEVHRAENDAVVTVHDPLFGAGPRRTDTAPDSDEAESGRGLVLLDILAPGWTVKPSPIGKRIRCRIPAAS
ncbi:ATP-binding protein, partial [Kitasatospora sp. RB6PN24]|uniref:ATP-binding protein n=1 Tax=Kitasatospora humi TaxID=2893891 RepID=UPI001E3B8E8D